MRIKLYSDASIDVARRLFPDKVDDPAWLEMPWRDDELNACKALELEAFITHPSVENYPYPVLDPDDTQHVPEDLRILDQWVEAHPGRTLLSVGCGGVQGTVACAQASVHRNAMRR
ncbi:hypothetical protein D6833_05600 [Candidatus Parcubacteria bacterium]|nr:MAG: hypothetical protein D6833_05600 [Candidatus Parcubacteria bacterium]